MPAFGRPLRHAALAGLLLTGAVGLALFGRVWKGGEGAAAPVRRDPALAQGIDLTATADGAQRATMEALLAADRATPAPARITIDYPLDESIVPPDLSAPTFLWHDAAVTADRWVVEVELEGGSSRIDVLVPGGPPPPGEIDARCLSEHNEVYRGTPYQQSARAWKPDPVVWEAIKRRSVDRAARLTFLGYRDTDPQRVVSRGRITLSTSRDPVGAPIFYRDVPLMPSQTEEGVIKPLAKGALPLIIWRLRDVSRPESRVMLSDMPTCANCHSFSSDGRTMGMDIDGPQGDRGAYAVAPIAERVSIDYRRVITWNAFQGKPKDFMTIGFLSRVSPDGRFVVSTVNEALYVMNFWNYKFNQVFYPTRGILAYYSRATGEISALPGADDPEHVHCDPVWSPDGKTIVFARAAARDAYIPGRPAATYAGDPNETPIQYGLYRIPFNEGRGGRPEPIAGASGNGMSNTFPKVSPDGRWIVFVQCRNGQLMRPDSRLFIVPFEGGEARPMRCNLALMNSWHSFSPNGRWLVFSSKSNTPYTQMFLTHLDEGGRDSPAILVENSTAANRAVNIPEFVNVPYDRFLGIDVPAVEYTRHSNRGTDLAREGRHREAVVEFEKALAGERNDWKTSEWRIHDSLSKSLLILGQKGRALEHIRESLRLNPRNVEMQTNLANLLYEAGDYDRALQHLGIAIQLAPGNPKPWFNRATMRLERREPAVADFDETVRLDPKDPEAWYGRALARAQLGDSAGAVGDLDQALRVAPADWARRAGIDDLRRRLKAPAGGSL